jgi:hypothetical protein
LVMELDASAFLEQLARSLVADDVADDLDA